jgi:acetylornithine deacetylase/succinyl-diaminopimelate desuccinylase-like protein
VRRAILIGFAVLAAVLITIASTVARQPGAEARVRRVLESPAFYKTMAFVEAHHEQIVADTIRLTEIPAPPFNERARAAAFADLLRQAGFASVETDPEGNVIGTRKGTADAPVVAIAAHLDTVFPEGTTVTVKRTGTRLAAPGVGDNSRSLAVLLAIVRGMNDANVKTASSILFVANVGEEGPGDLRGVRYLFQKGAHKDEIKAFISIDGAGAGTDIVTGGVGSKRYRTTFKGPGGHSYGDFGIVNPAFAMSSAIVRLSTMKPPASPKTTFNVGTVGGGTSVNSIPFESWMELDLRSESAAELAKLDTTAHALVRQAVDEENQARSTARGAVTVDMTLIGDRASGETPKTSPLVQTAIAAVSALGMTPRTTFSSTDANIPMSLGIPAITLDSGGRGGRAHSLDEWIDVDKPASVAGIRCIVATLLTMAGSQ